MKVTADLKISDIVAVNLRNYVANRARYVMCVVIAIAYTAYLVADLGVPASQRAWLIYAGGGAAFAVAFFILFLVVGVMNAVVMVRDTSGVIGPHDIRISSEGFRDTTPHTDSLIRWSGVTRITRRGEYLSIWMSPYLAHIVPARAFADMDAFNTFEHMARAYLSGEAEPAPVAVVQPRVVIETDPKLWKRPA